MTWRKIIALVDMNAFFASVEQRDFPTLRGLPIAVTNGTKGSCIITCSYEARAHGIKTGMRLTEAKRLCPRIIQRPSRPEVYAATSMRIMKALERVTPDIEVFSVDEAFLDLSGCTRLWGNPKAMGRRIKRAVFDASGLLCSVGLSGDKTTAKYAAKLHKPDGLTIIEPDRAAKVLHDVPVTDLCGINTGIGAFLAARGVTTCGQMKDIPISALAERFGAPGRRVWCMAQGLDSNALIKDTPDPKTIGHSKIMPPNTRDRGVINTYLQHMAELVAKRLRKHGFVARRFWFGLRAKHGLIGARLEIEQPSSDGLIIFRACSDWIDDHWRGEGVFQVQLTATHLMPVRGQLSLFDSDDHKRDHLNTVMDQINERYGGFTIAPARLVNRSSMPNVIAPSWKPSGHRETILGKSDV